MKKTILGLSILTILMSCEPKKEESKTENTEMKTENASKLRHVVMFKFKDEATENEIQAIVDAFAGLKNEIPEIKDFEWGLNNSPEGLNEGLTHCFTLTFDSDADRDNYLPHPAHKAFGAKLGPILDKVVVVDYWTKD